MDPKKNKTEAQDKAAAGEDASAETVRTLTVTATENRRRGGRRFSKGENKVPVDALTEEQWRAVDADPVLSIRQTD